MKQEHIDKYHKVIGCRNNLKDLGDDKTTREKLREITGVPLSTADRYIRIEGCTNEMKKVFFERPISIELADRVAACTKEEQEELARIFNEAFIEDAKLKREAQKRLVDLFRTGIREWQKIKNILIKENLYSVIEEKVLKGKKRVCQKRISGIEYVDKMTGIEFEDWCKTLIENLGFYNVLLTKRAYDEGKDIVAEKDGYTYCFQCKKLKNNARVGISAVQEVYAAKGYEGYDFAIVITNQLYSTYTRRIAERLKVKLWDKNDLQRFYKMIENL